MITRHMGSNSLGLTVVPLVLALVITGSAFGHCDTMDGPVVKDAQAALEKGDAAGVLKWVPKENEGEIRQVFQKAIEVRVKGPEAKELTDMYFFETLVRLHRASEGVAFTGLKPAGTPVASPIAKSDEALKNGNVDDLAKRIGTAVETGIRERFTAASEARKHKDQSAEAGRTYVAAYVAFVHYVEALHDTATGHGVHHAVSSVDEPDMHGGSEGGGMKAMMAKMSTDMKMRCQMHMNTAVSPNDPAAILALKDQLKLTEAQTTQLETINKDARDKAIVVLTADQKKALDTMPKSPQTMKEMHEQMMVKMQTMMVKKQKMTGGKMGDQQMDCPMMKMMQEQMSPTTQPKADAPAEDDHAAHQ